MDELDPSFVSDLVGRTCEAAFDPAQWNDFVVELERVYPDSRVTLFGHDSGRPTANLAACVNYPAAALKDYAATYARCSPYIARQAALPVGRAFSYETVIGDNELRETEYYNDYLRPHRLGHYGAGLLIDRERDADTGRLRGTVISVSHHENDADRIARQTRLLDLLCPHLQRGLRLQRMIAAERMRAGATRAAFDHWAHPVLVLDAAARLVTLNRAAETLLGRADQIWLGGDGRLRTADAGKVRLLETAVYKCAAIPDHAGEAAASELDGIVLPSRSGAAALRVAIWPLPAGANPAQARAGALMMIFDPVQGRRTPVDWLAKRFGLLPSEQRLADAIVNGMPLAEAAEHLGIRLSTARTRLKTIQIKTDCRRQVDLVRLALSLAAVRQD